MAGFDSLSLTINFPLADGRSLVQGPLSYNADGLASIHNADFLRDPKFIEAYRLGMATGHRFGDDLHIEWRVLVACWAAWHGGRLEGDFVECGVNTGIFSRAVMHYIDFDTRPDKVFYLLDTYDGIPIEQLNADELDRNVLGHYEGKYVDCYERVQATFAAFPNARIVRGKVPETLAAVTSAKICYLSIDMNIAAPEIAAGAYFWDRLAPGAPILLDDYGWAVHVSQKQAWDAFAAERGVKVLSLPTGQGLILKS